MQREDIMYARTSPWPFKPFESACEALEQSAGTSQRASISHKGDNVFAAVYYPVRIACHGSLLHRSRSLSPWMAHI